MQCVAQTREVAECVEERDYEQAMALRGRSFGSALRDPAHDRPRAPPPAGRGPKRFRLAVLHAGGPPPA